ncbi:PREDICTED: EPIDERMAL PATTERNING FACTOR-like protein 2 [Tarenaya hassleriana]|uniref:EPIDERMAL PATTERNING FACTOR-like protein 2 n=1 Tax=Tarenaya hassleriana TaxID=28532 RepID=UPI00053C4F6A|nr:PREDICTED: EPIDERMAL PATTERNING FACTOR-like protein 2 [Tarenaya hassleriana]
MGCYEDVISHYMCIIYVQAHVYIQLYIRIHSCGHLEKIFVAFYGSLSFSFALWEASLHQYYSVFQNKYTEREREVFPLASVKMACGNMSSILLFLLILNSTHLRFKAQGRGEPAFTKRDINEEKSVMRGQIGSRPPSCERRCRSCGHCEAIQVPTNPQHSQTKLRSSSSDSEILNLDYARGDDSSSNYKPMSWKCKCGNSIFNP